MNGGGINAIDPSALPLKPEEKLLVAVIADALDCLRSPRRTWRHQSAARWFYDTRMRGPFFFESICQHFNWDAARIRQQLFEEGSLPPQVNR